MEFEDRGQLSEEDEESEEGSESESEDEIELPTGFGMSNSATEPVVVSPTITKVRYRECLKNHAVGLGGHALDGCGEFMPAGTEGTLDALKCAACNCHRNFHRKETDFTAVAGYITGGSESAAYQLQLQQQQQQQQHQQLPPYYRTPAGYLHLAPHLRPPPPHLALPSPSGEGGRAPMSVSAADQEDHSNPSGSGGQRRLQKNGGPR